MCDATTKRLCTLNDCQSCYERSFASCDKAAFLLYQVDQPDEPVDPRYILKQTHKIYAFTCTDCNHIFHAAPHDINGKAKMWCNFCGKKKLCDADDCTWCYEKSFASHALAKFWHPTKNESITPRMVRKKTKEIYHFQCTHCFHEFQAALIDISGWKSDIHCQYCGPYITRVLCDDDSCSICFQKSFASHPKAFCFLSDRNKKTARQIPLSSSTNAWFQCDTCQHIFNSRISHVASRHFCPYCAQLKMCESDVDCANCFSKSLASHPRGKHVILEKHPGIDTKRIFLGSSSQKIWFQCDKCSFEFDMMPACIKRGQFCPLCTKKTEKKLFDWLTFCGYKFHREKKYTWCVNPETSRKLPFDFVFEDLKCILELDGDQHFSQVSYWKDYQLTQSIDFHKMKCCLEQGYTMIRILQDDVYYDKRDWETDLLKYIQAYKKPTCVFLGDSEKYAPYQSWFESHMMK
jgi:very-short-patch-repair endonuclease